MVCTFFGHRGAAEEVYPLLQEEISNLITKENVNKFYVGNQGNFDHMVFRALKEIKKEHPFISFSVVLAYMPKEKEESGQREYDNSEYPEILAGVPRRFAIDKRNRWMIEKSDFVITHVKHSIGGAAKFKEIAEQKKKTVINI